MTGRLPWIPTVLRNAGLKVELVGGWESRGKLGMRPKVVVLHHTAAAMGRNAPSLNVVIQGRSDLPGPLCHVLVGRDGTCYVIASGVANHAGEGQWAGVTGNSQAIGIEVENTGTGSEPWTPALFDVMVRSCRALAKGAGIPPAMVCGHKEWAPRRKVDPYGIDMRDFRNLVANEPEPELPEDPMAYSLDIAAYVDACYAEAGKRAGTDKAGRNYWALTVAEHEDPKGVLNYMRDQLGLKPVT